MMKFFQKKKSVVPSTPTHEREIGGDVFRDWFVMIVVTTVLILVALGFGGYLLFKINQGNFFKVDSEATLSTETLNRKTLLNVSEFFESRKKEYETLRATALPRIDPSI